MFSNFQGRQGMSIFNRRRRPRQAVYASPQSQSTTTPLQIDIPDETLAEFAQDFESSSRNYNHFVSNTEPLSSYNSYTMPSSQSGQFSSPLKHPSNHSGNENSLSKKAKFEQESYFRGGNNYSFGQQQNKAVTKTGSFPTNTGNTFTSKPQNSTKRNFSFDNNTNKLQQSYFGQKSQYSWNGCTNSPAKATTEWGNARQPRNNDRASLGVTLKNQNKNSKNESTTVKKEVNSTSGDTSFSLQTVDKSMKFVTSTIQGVRRWSEYRDQISLLFEIFGGNCFRVQNDEITPSLQNLLPFPPFQGDVVVTMPFVSSIFLEIHRNQILLTMDSVPTSNNNGTAKLFNIKDSSGSSRCIYWEMDQKLPRVARAQLYRLVGSLDRKTGHFQCFTIRQAQPHEQRLAKQQVEICNNAMSKLISTIAES